MRAVTSAASRGDGFSTRGKVSGRPRRIFTLAGRIFQPRRAFSLPVTAIGTTGTPV